MRSRILRLGVVELGLACMDNPMVEGLQLESLGARLKTTQEPSKMKQSDKDEENV